MSSSAPTPAENYPEKRGFEKRRKLDHEDGSAPARTGPPPPPTPLGGPHDGRYHYDMYGMPMPVRYPYDDGHYREPPSMPYARGHPAPSPKHPHGPHPGYAYPPPPPPPKEYYHNAYHMTDYPPPPPPPGWSGHHPPPPHAYHAHHPGSGGQPFSPRFSQPYEYERHYATEPNASRPKPSPTTANADGSYQSPTSVVNSLDTRSPEGSRNLNNFEERVGDGAPPASQMPPYHPPPQPYYPRPIHSPASAHTPAHNARQWWSCDYCSYKFSSWEECSAHESMCPSRTHHPHHARSSKKRAPDSAAPHHHEESRFMDPHEEYAHNTDRPTFSLAQPLDGQSLSDRQCYVRTHFVELFVATEADVSARHSRGAQKLHLNQVGLRCAYCAKLKPRDRAERAVCYPSSISRIYQTVADMQRFHFEACSAIPATVLRVYKSLKTTRPRGVGSPQSYWDKSARELGLMDTEFGIMLKDGGAMVLAKDGMEDGVGVGGGVALIPSLTNGSADVPPPSKDVHNEEGTAGAWEESAVHDSSSTLEDVQDRAHAPCSEADASILLMLKNPEGSNSPKSADEAVTAVTEV
ncbi:hypothetical protein ACHAWX_003780 [Stephanocyclus meneghinianus]